MMPRINAHGEEIYSPEELDAMEQPNTGSHGATGSWIEDGKVYSSDELDAMERGQHGSSGEWKEDIGQGESFARGAVRGVPFGTPIMAAGMTGVEAIKNPRTELLDRYRKIRDEQEARADAARKANPKTFIAGELGGADASSFVPGLSALNVGRGAGLAANIAKPIVGGGLYAAGRSDADFTKGEFEKAIPDITEGAAFNLAGHGVLSGLGSIIRGMQHAIRTIPEERALKAATGQGIEAKRRIANVTGRSPGDINPVEDRLRKVGKDLLDEKVDDKNVIGFFDRTEDIAPKLAEARKKYGRKIGEIRKESDVIDSGGGDPKRIAESIIEYAQTVPPTNQGKKIQDRLVDEAENFYNMDPLSLEKLHGIKQQFKYNSTDADALISSQDAVNQIKKIVSAEMDRVVGETSKKATGSTKKLLDEYANIRGKYKTFKTTADAATNRVLKNKDNRFASPSDYAMGIGGALMGGEDSLGKIMAGIGAGAANKFARERGSAIAARSAYALRNALESKGYVAFREQLDPILRMARNGDVGALNTIQILRDEYPDLDNIIGDL